MNLSREVHQHRFLPSKGSSWRCACGESFTTKNPLKSSKWVLRCWGMHYEYEPRHREVWELCWVTKTGAASSKQMDAHLFDSEADAWAYAASADMLSHDEEHGDWCFPEEIK